MARAGSSRDTREPRAGPSAQRWATLHPSAMSPNTDCFKTLALLAAVAACVTPARARPPWQLAGRPSLAPSAECHTDDELLDLCQRCAKLTKSPLAYRSCCSADLEARRWCADFVYFGKGADCAD